MIIQITNTMHSTKVSLLLIFSVLFLKAGIILSQDIHFSQFNVSPTLTNPAAAGPAEMDYRIVNNYKNQWGAVSAAYSTLALAFDMSILKNEDNNRYLGIGISGFADAAGKSRYGTTQGSVSLAGVQRLSNNGFLSAGIMYGYAQRKVSLASLSWDSQYNGEVYDPNLPTDEAQYGFSKSYSDVGAGLMWQRVKSERVTATIGASVLHLNRPVNSFNSEVNDRLNRRIILNADFDIKLASQVNRLDSYLHPKLIYSSQGTHQEIILGLFIKNVIQAPSRYTNFRNLSIFEFGGFYRIGDAVVVACGMDYKKFKCGLSYDINVSKLHPATTYRGGLEISLMFKGIFTDSRFKIS